MTERIAIVPIRLLLRTIVRLPCLLLIVALHGRNISEFFQLFHITLRSALFLVSERAGSHFANGQPRSKSRAALGSFADIDETRSVGPLGVISDIGVQKVWIVRFWSLADMCSALGHVH
jgi:hypothetical protein